MKKIYAILFSIVLFVSPALSVHADAVANTACTVTVGTKKRDELKRGEIVAVTVALQDCTEKVKAIALTPDYDENVFEMNTADSNWNINGLLSDFNGEDAVILFLSGQIVEGEIFTFYLQVKENATYGTTNIKTDVVLTYENDTVVSGNAKQTTVTIVSEHVSDYLDLSDYRDGNKFEAPKKDGYVFAGWYNDAALTDGVLPNKISNNAYAKFINPKTFTIKNQFNLNANSNSKSVDLRIITTIDSTNYTAVEFEIALDGVKANKTLKTTTVYTSLVNNLNNGNPYKPSEQFCEDSVYFAVEKLTNIPSSIFESTITIIPKYYLYDGTVVTGTPRDIVIADAMQQGN